MREALVEQERVADVAEAVVVEIAVLGIWDIAAIDGTDLQLFDHRRVGGVEDAVPVHVPTVHIGRAGHGPDAGGEQQQEDPPHWCFTSMPQMPHATDAPAAATEVLSFTFDSTADVMTRFDAVSFA